MQEDRGTLAMYKMETRPVVGVNEGLLQHSWTWSCVQKFPKWRVNMEEGEESMSSGGLAPTEAGDAHVIF